MEMMLSGVIKNFTLKENVFDCAGRLACRDLKAAQINMKHSLILELVHYEFELGHNTMEVTENICCVKG